MRLTCRLSLSVCLSVLEERTAIPYALCCIGSRSNNQLTRRGEGGFEEGRIREGRTGVRGIIDGGIGDGDWEGGWEGTIFLFYPILRNIYIHSPQAVPKVLNY